MTGQVPIAGLTLMVFVGALVTFGCMAMLANATLARRAGMRTRLAGVGPAVSASAEVPKSIRRKSAVSRGGGRWWAEWLPLGTAARQRLDLAGLGLSTRMFTVLSVVLGLVLALVLRIGALPMPLALALGAAGAILVPRMLLSILTARRRMKFLAQFPDAIDLMIRCLRSGFPVDEALAAIADEMPDPAGGEFRRLVDRLRLGQELEIALAEAAGRLELPDFNFFVISISIQRETGGNLNETLANLADILRRRQQMRHKVMAMSAEARTSTMIIGSLPFLLAGALYMANPSYVGELFADPRGRMILFGALGSEAFGILTMVRMARFEI